MSRRRDFEFPHEAGKPELKFGIVEEEFKSCARAWPHDYEPRPGVEVISVHGKVKIDFSASVQPQPGPRPDIASAKTYVLNGSAKQELGIADDDLGKAVAAEAFLFPALFAAGFRMLLMRFDISGLAHSQTPSLEVAEAGSRRLFAKLRTLLFICVCVLAVSGFEGN